MEKKRGNVLREWGFFIFLFLFGCVYLTVWGLSPHVRSLQGLTAALGTADAGERAETETLAATGQEEAELQETDGLQEETVQEGEPADLKEVSDIGETSAEDETLQNRGEIIYQTVEDDYFADAVFIGDSRTVGMYEYGGLEEISTFCCSTGLTVYKMFDAEIVNVPGQRRRQTVEETLSQRQYSAIYLMIGINEMGTGTVESFIETYRACVEHLRELQPTAVIYLQGIIRVTEERSAQGDYITNEGIDARNEEIAKIADDETIFYLDVNPLICDETGGMVADYTYDGVHLKAQYISVWKDYLKSHVVQ